jgi:hypothetical protein
MDSDEREICIYLKSYAGQWVSAREIARRAGGKHRFREDPHWAAQPLARLMEKSLLESDTTGHYRLKPQEKTRKKVERWISPELKKILEKSGKEFEAGVQLDAPEDFYDKP